MARCMNILIRLCVSAVIENQSLNDPLLHVSRSYSRHERIFRMVQCAFLTRALLPSNCVAELGMNGATPQGGKRAGGVDSKHNTRKNEEVRFYFSPKA